MFDRDSSKIDGVRNVFRQAFLIEEINCPIGIMRYPAGSTTGDNPGRGRCVPAVEPDHPDDLGNATELCLSVWEVTITEAKKFSGRIVQVL